MCRVCSTVDDANRNRIRAVVDHDYTDVWAIGADGTVDFRMDGDFFQQIRGAFPECVVVADVETLVRDAEKMMKGRLNATWFEEYVSSFLFVVCLQACG